ncbi:MAG: Ig-like domain-containing protein, partial [Sphingomonadaceae bacterium]
MHVPPLRPRWRRPARTTIATLLSATLLGAALQGCGGGGGSSTSSNCTVIDPTRPSSLPGCPTTPVTPPVTPPVATPSISMLLRDAAGATINAVTPQASGTLAVTIKNSAGAVVPGVVVSFVTTDKSGGFIPASGTALSDANGVASITLPSGTQSGAYTATASASVGGSALSASVNYSVTLPVLTLSSPSIIPATLAAGGTAGLSVTVLNGSSVFTPLQAVTFSSPCASAGKAKISSPVSTVNGVASTSYTDLGCGSSDLITASITYNGNTATSTGALAVTQASAGQLAFVSALPQNIALRGTGGAGRQESSTVSFKVLDRNGNPVSGQQVNFTLNTTLGGLTLNPASATTGANGVVSTAVAAGTVNTPVRVTATLPGSTLSTLSDQLVVSTGVPEQNSFTLSSAIRNVEGGSYSGCAAPTGAVITARLADHFHNPAPDGTAVSFTAESGSIDASCLTGLVNTTLTDGTVITQKGVPGECSVRFCAGNPRKDDNRITILAYALG